MEEELLIDDDQCQDVLNLDVDEEAALLGLSDNELGNDGSDYEENHKRYFKGRRYSSQNTQSASENDDNLSNNGSEIYANEAGNTPCLDEPTQSTQNPKYQDNLVAVNLSDSIDLSEHEDNYRNEEFSTERTPNESLTRNESPEDFDEESDDESDDHRDRFRSERINTSAKRKRTDIPDSLDSVLDVEEEEKAQAFLSHRNKRQFHRPRNSGPRNSMSNSGRRQPLLSFQPHTSGNIQIGSGIHVIPQFGSSREPSNAINLQPQHQFLNRGFEQAYTMPTEHNHPAYHNDAYQSLNAPPVHYSEPYLQATPFFQPEPYLPQQMTINVVPQHFQHEQPVLNAPPINHQNQQFAVSLGNAMPPHPTVSNTAIQDVWSHPPPFLPNQQQAALPITSQFSRFPNPTLNYENRFLGNNFQEADFHRQTQLPMEQHAVNCNPPWLQKNSAFQLQEVHTQHNFSSTMKSRPPLQGNNNHQRTYAQPAARQQAMSNLRPNSSQIHVKKVERRPPNFCSKNQGIKQQRTDSSPRKQNFTQCQKISNIKEIPLIDTLPEPPRKVVAVKTAEPVVEDEDEETREYRKKIELQKQIREEILLRKELRRKQMATQRALELKSNQKNFELVAVARPNVNLRLGVNQSTMQTPLIKPKPPTPQAIAPITPVNKVINIQRKIGDKQEGMPKAVPTNTYFSVASKQAVDMKQDSSQTAAVKTIAGCQKAQEITSVASAVVNKPVLSLAEKKLLRQKKFGIVTDNDTAQASGGAQKLLLTHNAPNIGLNRFITNPLGENMTVYGLSQFQSAKFIATPSFRQRMTFISEEHRQFSANTFRMKNQNVLPTPFKPQGELLFHSTTNQFSKFRKGVLQNENLQQQTTTLGNGTSELEQNTKKTEVLNRFEKPDEMKARNNNSLDISDLNENSRVGGPSSSTKSVEVRNLSSSTTEEAVKKIALSVGPIEAIQLNTTERSANIVFKNSSHASQFQTKFQRYMLDLSMIEVILLST